jgi:hypothetical protein
MRWDIFVILVATVISAILIGSSIRAQENPTVTTAQSYRTVPVTTPERISVLENNYIHLNASVQELKLEFRSGIRDIKSELSKGNDESEKWMMIILGLLLGGDKGLSLMRKLKEGRKV